MAKIALLAGWYFPESVGGTEEYVRALARDLRSFGHEICVAAPAVDETEREYEHDGVPVYRYPVSLQPHRDEVRGAAAPQHISVFTRWLQRQAFDIVHSHSLTRGCGVAHLQRVAALGTPYVVTVHTPNVVCERGTLMRWGTTPCDGRFRPVRCAACCIQLAGLPQAVAWPVALASRERAPSILPGPMQTAITFRRQLQKQRSSTRAALASAEGVVAVSQWLLELLREMGVEERRLHLSRQGIAREEREMSPRGVRQGSPLRVAYIGRFDRVKGVDVLLRAFARLPRECAIELHLFGVAQGTEGEEYLAALRRLAAGDRRITFHGALSPANRARVLGDMDVVAVPSMWFETGPLVVLEAFAAGLPVLGSNLGGIAERVRHGESGWLIPPGDVGQWTTALSTLHQRWKSDDWAWRIPAPRTSLTVALEMDELYQSVLDDRLSAAPRQAVSS